MSNTVDRIGTFRFDKVLEIGVSLTKNKFPSFNIRVRLSEFFDEDEGKWVDWLPGDVEQTAYFTLFGKDKKTEKIGPCLNHAQVMKVFNWEGKSFQILSNDDYSKIKGQLRIGNNTYDGAKSSFQVDWMDVFDADPVRQLRKLEADELKGLDKDFAHLLQSTGKAATVASAPTTKGKPASPPRGKKPAPPETEAPEPVLTPTEKKAAIKAKSDKNKAAAKSKKPGPPARKPRELEPQDSTDIDAEETGGKEYTKQEAFEIIVEMQAEEVTDEIRTKAWIEAIEAIAGDVDDGNVTKQQWGQIVDAVLDTEYEDGKTVGKF